MNITSLRAWRVTPPHDTWNLISLTTDSGLTGWGEFTGSGHEAAAVAILADAAPSLLGRDALDTEALLAPVHAFRYPPLRDKIAAVAWSAVAQALWDVKAQAFGRPLCRLLGATPKPIRLYANLNRGLFRDRTPEAHARHAEAAIAEGFAYAKCTPFDNVTPADRALTAIIPALERMRMAADAVGADYVAVDCHRRLGPSLARTMLEETRSLGGFAWFEDLAAPGCSETLQELRCAFPEVAWAGGEEALDLAMAVRLLTGSGKPDIFMPDIKYICGPDRYAAIIRLAESCGSVVYPHSPSGPISLAFSAHLAALGTGCTVEYPFMAVPEQGRLVAPAERVEKGWYHIDDEPGIGAAPSMQCLAEYGTVLFEAGK